MLQHYFALRPWMYSISSNFFIILLLSYSVFLHNDRHYMNYRKHRLTNKTPGVCSSVWLRDTPLTIYLETKAFER